MPDQRVDAVELQFVTDEADKGDIEGGAIEVALEAEQEHFEQRRAIVEGRTAAEACDGVKTFLIFSLTATDPHRIDAMLEAAILVETDIGGGIAEIAAAFLAVDHLAGDEPRPAQHGGGVVDLALGQRHADGAGGYRPFRDIDMGLDIDLDTEPRRLADQEARRADATLAEMKVVADRDPADAEPRDQVMVNEILRGGAGAGLVEGHHHGAGEPRSGQQPQLVGLVGEAELGAVRAEKAARMRLEGYGKGGLAVAAAHLQGGRNNGAVAQMDTVEIAHGDHRPPGDRGGRGGIADDGKTICHCRHSWQRFWHGFLAGLLGRQAFLPVVWSDSCGRTVTWRRLRSQAGGGRIKSDTILGCLINALFNACC